MRIIKRGDPDKPKVHELTCWKCQTLFEYMEGEVQVECLSVYTPPNTYLTNYFVHCPVCNQKLYIN